MYTHRNEKKRCVKVIENFTIRQRAYDFLLMFYNSLALSFLR